MAEIKDYSVTADDNNSASPNGMPENMAPSGVNNSWRESFARVKRWYEDINATKSTTGSSNAYVLAAARTVTAYAQGDAYMFRANHANTGAATLNIDSVGAVAIVNNTQSALAAGQIQAGGIYLVAYDATNSKFQLVGASATSASGDNIFVFNASPSVTLENNTAEDSDGGRESSLLFKGLQSGSEESTLVKIIGSHDGSSDDQKGKLQIYTNDGSDGDSPTLQVTIDSAGLCTLVGAASIGGSLTVAGATQLNSTVTVGANDQGYDVILYGDTASANVTWDTSVDDLILNGAAGLIVPDGQLTLGSTAITSTAAELNILDGVTASTAELNILDGVTSTTAEINILDGVTSTAAELNILDGVTSTTAELNILDGVTSTTAELNLVDGSGAGSIVNSKAVIYGSGGELNGTSMDITNVATASTFEPDGDTAAGDSAAIGYASGDGLVLTGQGSTNDVTIKNDADTSVLVIPTGTTTLTAAGQLNVGAGLIAQTDSSVGGGTANSGSGRYFDVYNTGADAASFGIFRLITQQVGSASTTSADFAKYKNGALLINNNDTHANVYTALGVGGSERLRITSAGNVGIGTTTPAVLLNVASGADGVAARFNRTSGGGIVDVENYNAIGGIGTNDNIPFRFNTNNTERVRIANDGKVGIGTNAPETNLHVFKASSGASTDSSAVVHIENSGTTVLQLSAGTSNDCHIAFGDSGNQNIGSIAYLNNGNHMAFRTDNSEKMRLTSGGDVLINATAAINSEKFFVKQAAAANAVGIQTTGSDYSNMITFYAANNSVKGTIGATPTAVAYNTSSDYRLKENVDYSWDATTRLKQLKPARFNFKADADRTVDGFLAHEVSSIVPEAISGTKDAVDSNGDAVYQGIDQSKLVPLLVKTIQELEARITALEAG